MTNPNPDDQDLTGDRDVSVVNDPAASRYVARLGGDLAGFAEYVTREGVVRFTHTEVDSAFEGKGIGTTLVRAALDDVRRAGGSVQPQCEFVRSWIDRHPDYQDMVVP